MIPVDVDACESVIMFSVDSKCLPDICGSFAKPNYHVFGHLFKLRSHSRQWMKLFLYLVEIICLLALCISVIFVNENENGEKRENNEFVNEN